MPDLSSSVRNLTVTSTSTSVASPKLGGSGAHGGSISNLLKPSPLNNTRSNSCSPFASKKGLNAAVSSASLASTTTTPRATTTTMPSSTVATFAADCVKAHNEYRRLHKVPDLKLSPSLCKYAQEWADTLSRRAVLQSRGGTRYGENIFCVQSSAPIELSGGDPVEQWYKEGKAHLFGREPSTLKTGHFTQIVWRESEQIGVAIARNRNGQIFVVANYDPPGNVIGTYAENVPPIGGFDEQQQQQQRLGSATGTTTNGGGVSRVEFERLKSVSRSFSRSTSGSYGVAGGVASAAVKQRDYVANRMPHNLSFSESVCESDDLVSFARGMLRAHNEFRRKHGVPELTLDNVLNGVAQSWAVQLGKSDSFGHNPSTKYGENIYCMWSSDRNASPNPRDVCKAWYDEIRDYSFGNESRGRATTGHFTQVVWKSSKKLGVGLAKTRTGKVVVVCNYEPSGNVAGQYVANVPRGN